MHTTTILRGQRVVLVPSTPDHVGTYYRWMTDPKLLQDTGTDPLTLEEVYEMERHWREDPDKLTLIILAGGEEECDITALPMIGDVNVFLKGDPSDEDFEAEIGVMIAEENYRGRGIGLEAMRIMLSYVTESPASFAAPLLLWVPSPPPPFPIRLESLVVRVRQENEPSIKLFKRLGFVDTKGTNAFGEKEMRLGTELSSERMPKFELD